MEVIDAEEESDTAGRLVTYSSALTVSIRTGEKKSGLRARRSYHDPPLGAPVIRQRWRVLHEVEAQHLGEERDRGVVVVDDHGNQVDLHRSSVKENASASPLTFATVAPAKTGIVDRVACQPFDAEKPGPPATRPP